jgi:hypothetical protein
MRQYWRVAKPSILDDMAIYIPFVEMRRLQKKGYLVRPVLLGALQSWG